MMNDGRWRGVIVSSHLLLSLFLTTSVSSSYAPDDTGSFCLDMSALPDYPGTVKRLMDSWSYRRLLAPSDGVWMRIDADNDNISWSPVILETCREKVRVSEPQSLPQDNWLITQYINKSIPAQYNTGPTTIFINISYILDTTCSIVNCNPIFQLLYHLSNVPNDSIALHREGYTLLANVSSTDDTSLHMMTFNFTINPGDNGFYIGIRDIGANITITRLFAYRLIGPALQVGLTLFPEVPAPTTDCVNVTGLCVANANTSSGRYPLLTLDPNGNWSNSEDCLCIAGHHIQVIEGLQQCQACPPSTYKSTLSNTDCRPCPANSQSTVHGASMCMCNTALFRAPNEGPDDPCTGPPSAPTNINVNEATVTNVSAIVTWGLPEQDGGRSDTYYDVFYYSSDNFMRRQANKDPVRGLTYNFNSLNPLTSYFVSVVAENGVSNQSANSQRSVFVAFTTKEGVPEQVVGVNVLDGSQYVEWNASSNSRGPVTKYEVVFYHNISQPNHHGRFITVSKDVTVYRVNITSDFPQFGQPVYVSVRGYTQVGPGEWSEPIVFSQNNPLAPTTLVGVSTTPTQLTSTSSPGKSTTPATTTTTSFKTTPTATSNPTTTPTATPTEGGSSPIVSIMAVLGGAIGIVVLVSLGALGYFVFRKLRLKYFSKPSDDIDAPLVKYEVVAGEEEEDRVQLNPMAEDT